MNCLFNALPSMKERLVHRPLFIFLDYDGTLSPITTIPRKALLPARTRRLLRDLSRLPDVKIAIISGRIMSDVRKKVGIRGIIYSGNHGLEIEGPSLVFKNLIPPGTRALLRRIRRALAGRLSPFKGVFIEDKALTLSLHFRCAAQKDIAAVSAIFNEITRPFLDAGKIRINPGKMVFEVKPPLQWDKGRAVKWILQETGRTGEGEKFFPVYVGDDLTDEDAFRVLGNRGLTVHVGTQRSRARYCVKDTGEVFSFLQEIKSLRDPAKVSPRTRSRA